MDLKETYNRIAEDWVKDHNQDDWWLDGAQTFLSLLPAGATILDVGCGGGIKTKYLNNNGFKVTGVDFSEKMIEISKRNLPDLDFDIVDIYEIDKYEKTFDAIFAQAVLLHISKNRIVEVLEKLKSRLNTGGLLYVAVKGIREDGVEEKIDKENDYGYEYERFFSFYSLEEMKQYFEQVGLEVVWEKIANSGRTDWVQVIGKKIS